MPSRSPFRIVFAWPLGVTAAPPPHGRYPSFFVAGENNECAVIPYRVAHAVVPEFQAVLQATNVVLAETRTKSNMFKVLSRVEPVGCPDVPPSKIVALLRNTEVHPLGVMELYALGVEDQV